MNEDIKEYIEKYPTEIIKLFNELRELIYNSTTLEVEEKCGLNYQLIMLVNHS